MMHDDHDAAIDTGASPAELFRRIHHLLRGRYWLAIVLGALGAALAGAGAYMSQTPLYRSTGVIQVRPMLGKILDETEMSSVMPMFRNYVNTQAALVESRRVLDRAMQSEAWAALGRGITPREKMEFEEALTVDVDARSGELISVHFLDEHPKAAQVAVREVITAYRDLHAEDSRLDDPQRLAALHERQRMLESEIARREALMQTVGEEYGTIDLAPRHEKALEHLVELESLQRQLEIQLEAAEIQQAGQTPEPVPVTEDLDVAQIAVTDAQMAQLLHERRLLAGKVQRLRASGIGPKHRDMKLAIAEVEAMDGRIRAYKQQWMATHEGGPAATLATGDPETLRARAALVATRLENWRTKTTELGRKRRYLEGLADQNQRDHAEAVRIVDRLEQIRLESKVQDFQGVSGRISIINDGTLPVTPAVDRRIKLGAACAFLGGAAPVGLIMLLGLLTRRYQYSDETRDQIASPLLGILPMLPDNMTDPEQASVAAHCVHQIRTLLQLGAQPPRQGQGHTPVFGVTSPTPGDGKTSLALSLGLSFASAGARTLLIDCDMIGGGLTSSLKLRNDDGGIGHAMDAGAIDAFVRPCWMPRLFVLPAGRGSAEYVTRLNPDAVRRIFTCAREAYDVVVVDTGPVLGSLEAVMVGKEADGVVLVLGRGQLHADAKRAMKQLASVGARVLGVVFNRAKAADFKRSMSSASLASTPTHTRESDALRIDSDTAKRLDGLGPMARTIAASVSKVA